MRSMISAASSRRNAAECLDRAREALRPGDKAEWLAMAEFWQELAHRIEHWQDAPARNAEHSEQGGHAGGQ
jgi:hypothetical protein